MRLTFTLWMVMAGILSPLDLSQAQDSEARISAMVCALLEARAGMGRGTTAVRIALDSVVPRRASISAARRLGFAQLGRDVRSSTADIVLHVVKARVGVHEAVFHVEATGNRNGRRPYMSTIAVTLIRDGTGWKVEETRVISVT